MQSNQAEQEREKKNQNKLSELSNIIKHNNICIIGIPEGEESERGTENLFEEITAGNFLNLGKETEIQTQEALTGQDGHTKRHSN